MIDPTYPLGLLVVALLTILAVVVLVLWILMPFAVFGSRRLLRALLSEQQRTNTLLEAVCDAQAIRTPVGRGG